VVLFHFSLLRFRLGEFHVDISQLVVCGETPDIADGISGKL
jgi:hypothetical protein